MQTPLMPCLSPVDLQGVPADSSLKGAKCGGIGFSEILSQCDAELPARPDDTDPTTAFAGGVIVAVATAPTEPQGLFPAAASEPGPAQGPTSGVFPVDLLQLSPGMVVISDLPEAVGHLGEQGSLLTPERPASPAMPTQTDTPGPSTGIPQHPSPESFSEVGVISPTRLIPPSSQGDPNLVMLSGPAEMARTPDSTQSVRLSLLTGMRPADSSTQSPALTLASQPGITSADGTAQTPALEIADVVLGRTKPVNTDTERSPVVAELATGIGTQREALSAPEVAASHPVSRLTSPEPEVLVEQMVRGVRFVADRQGGSVRISLEPPELGMVRIRLDLNQDRARGWIEVSSRSTQELLEQNVPQLRRALQSHGIHLQSLIIRPETGDSSPGWSRSLASGFDGQSADADRTDEGQPSERPAVADAIPETPEAVSVPRVNWPWGWDLFA